MIFYRNYAPEEVICRFLKRELNLCPERSIKHLEISKKDLDDLSYHLVMIDRDPNT